MLNYSNNKKKKNIESLTEMTMIFKSFLIKQKEEKLMKVEIVRCLKNKLMTHKLE